MILALKKSKTCYVRRRNQKNSIDTSSFIGKQDFPIQKGQILSPLKKEKLYLRKRE